jgi:predicted alpha/beta hydrolase family esterase
MDMSFFDFEIDPTVTSRANEFIIFVSDNDQQSIQDAVAFLREKLPTATVRVFHDYGHFTLKSMQTGAFPELLEVILQS